MKPKYLEFCGINSFSKKACIDFQKLLTGGIFGIFGDTGSGKTTILDSMIFALYGKIDRIKGGISNEIINYGCDSAYVIYDFEIETHEGRKVFRVERSIKRKNSAQAVSLSELKDGRIIALSDGVKNTNAKIAQIVGLSFEDFKKCIALPQGEFAQFVKADRADRLKLISRLFGLEKYGEILAARVKERYLEMKSKIDLKEGELKGYADISEELLSELKSDLKNLYAQKQELDAQFEKEKAAFEKFKQFFEQGKEYHFLQNTLKDLLQKNTEIDLKRQALKKYLSAQNILSLREEEKNNRKKADETSLLLARLREKYGALQKELEDVLKAKDAENLAAKKEEAAQLSVKLAYARDDANQLADLQKERETLLREYKKTAEQKASLEKDIGLLEKEQEKIEKQQGELPGDSIDTYFLNHFDSALLKEEYVQSREYFSEKLAELQSRFSEQKGEKLYTAIEREIESRLKLYQSRLSDEKISDIGKLFEDFRINQKIRLKLIEDRNTILLDKANKEAALQAANSNLSQWKEKGLSVKEKIDAAEEKIKKALQIKNLQELDAAENKIKGLKDEIARKEEDYRKKELNVRKELESVALLVGKKEAEESQLQEEIRKNAALREKFSAETSLQSYEQAEVVVNVVKDPKLTEKEIAEHDAKILSVQAKLDFLQKDGVPSRISEEEFSERECKFKALNEKKQQVFESYAVYSQQIKEKEEKLAKKRSLEADRDRLNVQQNLLLTLKELIRGNNFMEFVASEYLSDIAADATRLLLKLTGGRYFIRYEQGFWIGDNLCGGELRSVGTLSGGETFLVSLSLALSLSSAIHAKSLQPIEFFFLDEGFGTLDEKLIDTVMDSLEKLKNNSFSIGLISHVEELKHRIDHKIIVTGAAESGSSEIQINA